MITEIKPQLIWKNFANICRIPHPSKHEQEIVKHIEQFAKSLSLEYKKDAVGNILVKKDATRGYENLKKVVLQAHVDMVPQKNNNIVHDFLIDPIIPYIEDGWVTAQDTTLGADNGIGVASIMAILESNDIEHGPIEALFTIDEETGMTGAFNLKDNFIEASILINTDTEDENELIIGCAGGIEAQVNIPLQWEHTPNLLFFKVSISGLRGGHSGIDINTGRANANVELCKLLFEACQKFQIHLAFLEGGNMRNAIPREAVAIIGINTYDPTIFFDFIKHKTQEINKTFGNIENTIRIVHLNLIDYDDNKIISIENTKLILETISSAMNGVVAFDKDFEGIVETSLNLSIINTKDSDIELIYLLRSSDDEEKKKLCNKLEDYYKTVDATVSFMGNYPGWKPKSESEILNVVSKVYEIEMGRKPEIKVVHAGLECGVIGNTFPHLDMISFGPTIKFPHSPEEKVSIESVQKYWNLLKQVLKNVPM